MKKIRAERHRYRRRGPRNFGLRRGPKCGTKNCFFSSPILFPVSLLMKSILTSRHQLILRNEKTRRKHPRELLKTRKPKFRFSKGPKGSKTQHQTTQGQPRRHHQYKGVRSNPFVPFCSIEVRFRANPHRNRTKPVIPTNGIQMGHTSPHHRNCSLK